MRVVNLAAVLKDGYPNTDLLPLPEEAWKDFDTLYGVVQGMDPGDLGDGLFRFLVLEIHDNAPSLKEQYTALSRAMSDIAAVLDEMERCVGIDGWDGEEGSLHAADCRCDICMGLDGPAVGAVTSAVLQGQGKQKEGKTHC